MLDRSTVAFLVIICHSYCHSHEGLEFIESPNLEMKFIKDGIGQEYTMFECYADSVNVLNSFFDIVGSADKFYWLLQKVISSLKLHTQYSRIGHPQSKILAISSYSMDLICIIISQRRYPPLRCLNAKYKREAACVIQRICHYLPSTESLLFFGRCPVARPLITRLSKTSTIQDLLENA